MNTSEKRRPSQETAPSENLNTILRRDVDTATDVHAIVTSAHITTDNGEPSLALTVRCPWCSREHSHGWPLRPVQDDAGGTVGDCLPRELLGRRYRLADPRALANYAIRDHTARKPVAA